MVGITEKKIYMTLFPLPPPTFELLKRNKTGKLIKKKSKCESFSWLSILKYQSIFFFIP